LRQDDYIVSTHRGHGHCIAHGAELKRMAAELLGKKTGYCRGMGGSMHIADTANGNLGANGIVGGGIALGVGAALGVHVREEDRVAAVFFSDGAANNGVFPESLNLAAVWQLPVIFVLENNHFAVCTPVEYSCRSENLRAIAQGYSVTNFGVDGNDVLAVYEKTREASALCRKGQGPVLLEADTYRHGGHHVNDPGAYMPVERLEHYKAKDPVVAARRNAESLGRASDAEISAVEEDVERDMAAAIDFARQSPEMSAAEFYQMAETY